MMGFDSPDEQEPIGHIGGYPIHAATLLAILHVAALFACTLLLAFNGSGIVTDLMFSSVAVLGQGHVWEVISYAFVHLPTTVWNVLNFAMEIWVLIWLGREVEKFMGRRFFVTLYGGLLLLAPAILLIGSFAFGPTGYSDSQVLHLCVIVAFAVIYPNAEFFLGIRAKWMAAILLGAWVLVCLASRNWSGVLVLFGSAALTYQSIRWAGVGDGLNLFAGLQRRFDRPGTAAQPKTKLLSRPEPEEDEALESVDTVLEKISKQGIGSLTSGERATLERARVTLLNRSKNRES